MGTKRQTKVQQLWPVIKKIIAKNNCDQAAVITRCHNIYHTLQLYWNVFAQITDFWQFLYKYNFPTMFFITPIYAPPILG